MPLPQSSVEKHPQKKKIIDLILANRPTREIAKAVTPPVSHMVIQRYRQKVVVPAVMHQANAKAVSHIPPETREEIVEARNGTKLAIEQNPITERLQSRRDEYDRIRRLAENKEDVSGFASIDRAETSALELQARLTGLLANEGPKTPVQIVIGIIESQPAALRVQVDDENVIDLTPR